METPADDLALGELVLRLEHLFGAAGSRSM